MPVVTIPDVELARVGSWPCSTGPWDCTPEDIAAAVTAAEQGGLRAPVIKLGHVDPRFDGQPSVGTIRNVRASADGQVLLGDLTGLPAWLAEVMPSAFPSRSIEGLRNVVTASGQRYRFALTGVSLLGVTPPAIQSLADIAALYGVAASSQHPIATGDPVVTQLVAASTEPVPSPLPTKGAGMDPAKIREALGLAADTSDEDVVTSLAEFRAAAERTATETERANTAEAEAAAAAAAQQEAVAASAATTETLHADITRLSGELAEIKASAAQTEKARFFEQVLASGRMRPADRELEEEAYDASPEVTRKRLLARTEGSAVPVAASGHSDDIHLSDDDAFYASLFGEKKASA